ncbi:MAG: ABC transporter ATP-binding protein [Planctomycetota bacterium]|jgi:ABC-2 type transport system ATP-binding protein
MVVSIRSLEKHYGKTRALGGVNLEVERGTIFGLLGQNGAGKTTLVKILLGLVSSSAGSASLLDRPVGTFSARREVGYLPEDHRLPEYHTAVSLLDFYGTLQGISRRERQSRIVYLLEMLGLKGREKLRIRGYSKGMKQRLGLAQALLHRPRVLFLDEPTDGVDPVGRKQIRELLLEEQKRGVTVFVNSHLLGEVEQLCDRVAILRKGLVVLSGSVAELTGLKATWLIGFDQPIPSHFSWNGGTLVPTETPGLLRLQCTEHVSSTGVVQENDLALDEFLAAAGVCGLRLRHLTRERTSLEDLYVALAHDAGDSL